MSSETKYYHGRGCIKKLCDELKQISNNIINTKEKKHISLTSDQQNAHAIAKTCYIYNEHFNNNKNSAYYKNFKKFIHHNHYTGLYEDAVHALCCLKYTKQRDIPVVIQNGSNHGFQLFIKELANKFREDIHCIPCDKEKYKTFSILIKFVDNDYPFMLKFINSNKFMMGSLESHVNNLSNLYICNCSNSSIQDIKREYDKYYIYITCRTCANSTKQEIKALIGKFPNTYQLCDNNVKKFTLLLKKGVYPYEYMDDWFKFDDKELPAIDKLYSNLNLNNITDKNYKHAKNVWKAFNISNMKEFHNLYVQSDTTQLADIFEQFRTLCLHDYKLDPACLHEYKLDPAYYCTTPGLAFDACLKYTNIKLELLTDEEMHLMFEKGIRGGVSQVIHRDATANNKYMNNHDTNAPSNYLMYVHANNLYGCAMSKKLPIDNFKWDYEIVKYTSDFIRNYDENCDIGYL